MSEVDNTNAIIRKFEPIIEGLSYKELSILNQMVVERLRLMQKAEDLVSMSKFNIGDRVSWAGKNGFVYVGIIQRINHKSISVKTGEREHWTVSPQLLKKDN
jgi:hypothetical protein